MKFWDADNQDVSVTLNLDQNGKISGLDTFKSDFLLCSDSRLSKSYTKPILMGAKFSGEITTSSVASIRQWPGSTFFGTLC